MINYATILSDFNDRGTLLKWLKKVEEALRAAGLDDVTVNVIDSEHITLSFDFADGSSVVSSTITLPRGPQGVPGQDGADGADGAPGADGTDGTDGATIDTATWVLDPIDQVITPGQNVTGYFVFTMTDGSVVTSDTITVPCGAAGTPGADGTVIYGNIPFQPTDPLIFSIQIGSGGTIYRVFSGAAANLTSTGATAGQVLVADGNGGVSWQTLPSYLPVQFSIT